MINVVRICSHNAMLALAKMDPELASAVVASHFDAKWSRIQKKQKKRKKESQAIIILSRNHKVCRHQLEAIPRS